MRSCSSATTSTSTRAGGYADERGRTDRTRTSSARPSSSTAQRYALYQSDPLLQAAHALVPWIITWDDHEVDNNYAGAISENDADRGRRSSTRRAAAYQVWYEHMPVRLDPPSGPDYEIYRSFAHGDLLRFHVLDTRQYRADQQRGEPFVELLGDAVQVRDEDTAPSTPTRRCSARAAHWLIDGVAASNAVWDVLAQQVFMFGGNAVAGSTPPVVRGRHLGRLRRRHGGRCSTRSAPAPTTWWCSPATSTPLRWPTCAPIRSTHAAGDRLGVHGVEHLVVVLRRRRRSRPWSSASARRQPPAQVVRLADAATRCARSRPTAGTATFRAVADQFDEASPVSTISVVGSRRRHPWGHRSDLTWMPTPAPSLDAPGTNSPGPDLVMVRTLES